MERWLRSLFSRLDIFFKKPSWFSEVASGMTSASWGVCAIVLEPVHAPSTQLLMRIHDSPVWGYLMLFLGLCQSIIFRKIDGSWDIPWLRVITAVALGWLWSMITLSTFNDSPWFPNGCASGGWAAVNAYLLIRALWRFR